MAKQVNFDTKSWGWNIRLALLPIEWYIFVKNTQDQPWNQDENKMMNSNENGYVNLILEDKITEILQEMRNYDLNMRALNETKRIETEN